MDDESFVYNLYGLKKVFKAVKAEVKAINNGRLTKSKINSESARAAGNQLYTQQNREQDTLMYYTKSIAYAPEDSEELALGFGNRSALLIQLNYYEECLVDINRSLEITKSDQLKSKLQSRKEKCLLLMEQLAINKAAEKTYEDCKTNRQLKLSRVRSSRIPCAAKCVSITNHKKYKRQLIASEDIKPGEIVIIERAYACLPETSKIYLYCSQCLRFTCNGIPCDFCAHVIYCSKTCKEESWKEYHDIECSILHSIHAILFNVEHYKANSNYEGSFGVRDVILLARVFIKAIKTEGLQKILNVTERIDNGLLDLFSEGIFEGNKFGYIYNLRCVPQNETVEFKAYFREMSVLYLLVKRTNLIPVAKKRKELNLSDKKLLLRLRDILMKLKSIIDLNAFNYRWYECSHTAHQDFFKCTALCNLHNGAFIAPFSSIINHSCVPNLCRLTLPQTRIVYASKPIKKGEKLTISYGPLFSTSDVAKRKSFLEQSIHYTCDCVACIDQKSFTRGINKKHERFKLMKVIAEFQRIFGKHSMNFFFAEEDVNKWATPTEASLKQALKIIELLHKHFEFKEACIFSESFEFYVTKAFHELYDRKRAILGYC